MQNSSCSRRAKLIPHHLLRSSFALEKNGLTSNPERRSSLLYRCVSSPLRCSWTVRRHGAGPLAHGRGGALRAMRTWLLGLEETVYHLLLGVFMPSPATILLALSPLCFPGGTCRSPVAAGDVLRGAFLVSRQHSAADLKPGSQRPHGGAVQRAPSHLAVPAADAAGGPGPSCGRPRCWPGALAHAPSWHAIAKLQIGADLDLLRQLCRLIEQCSSLGGPGWLQGSSLLEAESG